MKLLAIETSGPALSAALAEDSTVVAEVFFRAGYTHSQKLLPALSWMLGQTGWKMEEIARIAVSTGPGSFTGIRVGLACGRVLAQGLDIPMVGITSLDILAAGVAGGGTAYPAVDALRGEVFVRSKRKGEEVEIITVADLVRRIAALRLPAVLAGSAVPAHRAHLEKALGKNVILAPEHSNYPRAGVLASLAFSRKGRPYASVKPLYVRKSWAEEKR